MYKSKSYLQLVTVEVTGDDQTFGADNNNLLTLEEALGNGGKGLAYFTEQPFEAGHSFWDQL